MRRQEEDRFGLPSDFSPLTTSFLYILALKSDSFTIHGRQLMSFISREKNGPSFTGKDRTQTDKERHSNFKARHSLNNKKKKKK